MRKYSRKPKQLAPNFATEYLPFEALLGKRLVGNPEANAQLAGVMANSVLAANLKAPPIAARVMIQGPVGAGKTYAAHAVGELLQVPTATVNLGMVTPEGYRGQNIADGLSQLASCAGVGGLNRAERGILILDEFDKCLLRGKRDDFLAGMVYALLPILGGERVLLPATDADPEPREFNTRSLTVIACGAFAGTSSTQWRGYEAAMRALLRWGFPSEVASRFTHFVRINPLTRKETMLIVEREADALSELYRVGSEKPQLTVPSLRAIVRATYRHPLGMRFARSMIHQQLLRQARRRAVDDCIAP